MSFLTDLPVTVEPVEEARLIRVAGEIDYGNADHLRRHLDDARLEGDTTLLDLAKVEFMDSAGLEVLLLVDATGTADRLALVEVQEERLLS
jgi:anti-anti-sigma factor